MQNRLGSVFVCSIGVLWSCTAAVLATSPLTQAAPASWVRFVAPECNYTASFPVKPTTVDKVPGFPAFPIVNAREGQVRAWAAPTGRAVYFIWCTSFPVEFPRDQHFLEGVRDRNVKEANARLVSDVATMVGKHHARDYVVEATVQKIRNVGYVHLVDGGKYIYQLMVATQPDVVMPDRAKDIDPFFASFTFDEAKTGR